MTDMEFIKAELQKLQKILKARADMYIGNDHWNKATNLLSFETACSGALELLKEQESEEKRILKIVWDILHSGVSTDTEADQDWVYEQIRNQVHQVY